MDEISEDKIKKNFGKKLRAIRKSKGFSQETLAYSCGLDRTYIGGVERGERNISLINIHRIAISLKISPNELLND